MPKVSIVVPCYGVEKYLDRCVENLVNQTLNDIEIILVDDESPDMVPKMCDDWLRKDSRIKVIHKKNGGLGRACNSGIEVATGEFIAFCDSDDWVDLECYEAMYNAIIKTRSDAVYCGIKRVDPDGNVDLMSQAIKEKTFEENELIDFQFGMIASEPEVWEERYRQMSAKIVLYSGDIIRRNNIRFHSEREYISEDLLFNLDFLKCSHKVIEIPQAYYYYQINPASLTQAFRTDRFDKYIYLMRYMLDRYHYGKYQKEYERRVEKLFIGYVRTILERISLCNESIKFKYRQIAYLCNNMIWDEIAKKFPYRKLPSKKRLVFNLLRHKQVLLLLMIYKIKV